MLGRKRKAHVLEKDLNDEITSIILNSEDALPHTKNLLKTKPYFCDEKFDFIHDALRELETFMPTLIKRLRETKEINVQFTSALIALLNAIFSYGEYNPPSHLFKIVAALSNLLSEGKISSELKADIASLCECFMDVADKADRHTMIETGISTLNYLLDITGYPNPENKLVRKSDIKRLYSKRKFLDKLNLFSPVCSTLLPKLMSTVKRTEYLLCKEGEHIIGHLMSQEVSLVKDIHKIIMCRVPKICKSTAARYGGIYFIAWNSSQENVQKEIEESIQDIMIKVLNIPRAGYDIPKAGLNAFGILAVLHKNRRRKSFSETLNNLYTAVLWRNLKSDDPWKRCNAALVFLDVFPLEKPFSAAQENAAYIERQIETIKDLLQDESHFVRVTAIKGTFAILSTSIELFSVTQLRDVCNILFETLPYDESSYMVRKTIYESLEIILSSPPEEGQTISQAIILPILHGLVYSFYDENEKVRKAFVKMLIQLKEQSANLNIQYWDLIPLEQILKQLAVENSVVGEVIAKLIKDSIYTSGQDINKTISRFCKMLDWSPDGTKNFFRFSSKVLTVEEAFKIIVTVIGSLRKHLKDFLDFMNGENNESVMVNSTKKHCGKGTLEDISNKSLEKEASSESDTTSPTSSGQVLRPEFALLEKHKYVTGLIQLATIVWIVFRTQLNNSSDFIEKLYSLACSVVPMFLKHYKGTPVYYATVSFASNIPIGKLKPYSTVAGACISELKTVTDDIDISKLECLIYALCSWNLGNDVLDLAAEWLNFAFREQNLNNTAVPIAGQKKSKVRFQQNDGKPLLALKLLDILFSDVLNESRLLKKNYQQLTDMYLCLEKIMIILKRKMENHQSFNKPNTCLTDEFIYRTYCRYLRLMLSLHRLNSEDSNGTFVPFDSAEASTQVIDETLRYLLPHIPLETNGAPNLVVNCCLATLNEGTAAVSLGYTNEVHCTKLCTLAKQLLSIPECGAWFLESGVDTMNAVAEHSQYYLSDDDWNLMSLILPSLQQAALLIIVNLDVTSASVKPVKNIPKFRASLFGFLKVVLQRYGEKSKLFLENVRDFIDACILIVLQEIDNKNELTLHSKFDEHQFFVSLILKNMLLKPIFVSKILPSLKFCIKKYERDGYKLLSCVSILHTLIHSQKNRLNRIALEDTLVTCYEVIKNYEPQQKIEEINDSALSIEEKLNVKLVAIPVLEALGSTLNCSLHRD